MTWVADQNRATVILAEVALRYGLSISEILGRSRVRSKVEARQEAMWLIRCRLNMSYPELGAFFDRDHTTCMHGVRAHNSRLRSEALRSEIPYEVPA